MSSLAEIMIDKMTIDKDGYDVAVERRFGFRHVFQLPEFFSHSDAICVFVYSCVLWKLIDYNPKCAGLQLYRTTQQQSSPVLTHIISQMYFQLFFKFFKTAY